MPPTEPAPPVTIRRLLYHGPQIGSRMIRFAVFLAAAATAALAATEGDTKEFFEARVRPLLAKNCYGCHTSAQMGGLRLDSRERLLEGGKSGPAVTPGDPSHSLLIQAVSHTHERLKMPPQGKLADSHHEREQRDYQTRPGHARNRCKQEAKPGPRENAGLARPGGAVVRRRCPT